MPQSRNCSLNLGQTVYKSDLLLLPYPCAAGLESRAPAWGEANAAGGAESRMRLKECLSVCLSSSHRLSCPPGVPAAGDKACVFALLCRAGNDEDLLPKLSNDILHCCSQAKAECAAWRGAEGSWFSSASTFRPRKKLQAGTLCLLCSQPTSFRRFSVFSEFFWGSCLCKAPHACHSSQMLL